MPEIFAKSNIASPSIDGGTRLQGGLVTTGKSEVEVPLSVYKDINGITYSSKFFETDQDTTQIDEYVSNQIEKRGLKDSIASYEQIIQELFDKIGVEKNQESSVKYSKVLKYFEMLGRNKSKEERAKDLIKRAKESEKIKEQKRQEEMERDYLKTKEQKNNIKKENKQYKEKINTLEKQNEKAIKESQAYQAKIREMIDNQRKVVEQINELGEMNVAKSRQMEAKNAELQNQLKEALKREEFLQTKHNQLKSLI